MTDRTLDLLRHRPFLIAVIWEAACLVVAVLAYMRTPNPLFLIAGMAIGAAPLLVVILRLSAAGKAALRDRSKDIVQ